MISNVDPTLPLKITLRQYLIYFLTKISELEDQFFLKFTCNSKLMKEANFIKSKINFALLKHLNIPFKVEYSENLG